MGGDEATDAGAFVLISDGRDRGRSLTAIQRGQAASAVFRQALLVRRARGLLPRRARGLREWPSSRPRSPRRGQPQASDMSEHVQRRFHRDRVGRDGQRVDHRLEVVGDSAGAVAVALVEAPDQLLHLRPHDVREDEDAAPPPSSRNGRSRSSFPAYSVRPVSSTIRLAWSSSVVACYTYWTFGISASCAMASGSRLSDALRDVVDDDRLVRLVGDRREVRHGAAHGRLVVVRRDDQVAVDSERLGLAGQMHRVRVEYVPVPATTEARSPTASTAAAKAAGAPRRSGSEPRRLFRLRRPRRSRCRRGRRRGA